MIVVIFVSVRAHMRYLRCSLVIYALGGEFHKCNDQRCLCAIKDNILPLSYVTATTSLKRSISPCPVINLNKSIPRNPVIIFHIMAVFISS